jgi:hydrogenase maturation protease
MSLAGILRHRLRGRLVVVGVGNPWRADDGAGCRVAARLRAGGRVATLDAEEIPESFLGDILDRRPDSVAFVDAVDFGAPPGAVALLDRQLLERYPSTTHRPSLSLLMELVATSTGADVFVLAIQPRRVDLFGPMTAEVAVTADALAAMIEEALPADADGAEARGGP